MARARFVAAGALALVLCVAPAAGAAETLGLDPEKVRPGGEVTVSDEAFADPDASGVELPLTCTISLDGEQVSDLCEVDKTGALEATFAVPDDLEDGEYEVEAEAGDLSATAKLTVSKDAPEQTVEELGPGRGEHVITTPAGRSDENGRTPVYVLIMAAVGTLGVIVYRSWRSKNPPDPLAGGPMTYRPATGRGPKPPKPPKTRPGEQKPPPPKLNIPPPAAKNGGAPAAAPAAGPAPRPADAGVPGAARPEGSGLRLLARPDTSAQVVLLDLDDAP